MDTASPPSSLGGWGEKENNMNCATCDKLFDGSNYECHCVCCWVENCRHCNCEACADLEDKRLGDIRIKNEINKPPRR